MSKRVVLLLIILLLLVNLEIFVSGADKRVILITKSEEVFLLAVPLARLSALKTVSVYGFDLTLSRLSDLTKRTISIVNESYILDLIKEYNNSLNVLLYSKEDLKEENFPIMLYKGLKNGLYPMTLEQVKLAVGKEFTINKVYLVREEYKNYILKYTSKVHDARDLTVSETFSRLVVSVNGDSFSRMAAIYAFLTNSDFTLVEDVKELAQYLKEHSHNSLVYICSFNSLKNRLTVRDLYRAVIEVDDDEFIDIRVGFVTTNNVNQLSSYLLRVLLFDEIVSSLPRKALIVFMEDTLTLSRKIAREFSVNGYTPVFLTNYESTNLTSQNILKELGGDYFVTYINLHGNPIGMAATTTGPFLLSCYNLPEVVAPSVIITLSCETADIYEPYVNRVEKSVAIQLVSRGAFAYIGALKIEFSGEETSTALPELLIHAFLNGFPLGEAVKIVNNIHIKDLGGDPWMRAYTVLFGDPDLHVAPPKDYVKVTVVEEYKKFEVHFPRKMIAAVFEVPVLDRDIAKISFKPTTVYSKTYIDKRDGKRFLVIFVTRILSEDVGDFDPQVVLRITIDYKQDPFIYYIMFAVIIISLVVIAYLLRRIERK